MNENEILTNEMKILQKNLFKLTALNESHKKEIEQGNIGMQKFKETLKENLAAEISKAKEFYESTKLEFFCKMAELDTKIEERDIKIKEMEKSANFTTVTSIFF